MGFGKMRRTRRGGEKRKRRNETEQERRGWLILVSPDVVGWVFGSVSSGISRRCWRMDTREACCRKCPTW
jgi:hypothetical protein